MHTLPFKYIIIIYILLISIQYEAKEECMKDLHSDNE